MLVDHNAETRTALSNEFKNHDKFRIFSTGNAKTAAKLFDAYQIDLLLTELNLPEINGFKLLVYVKKKYPRIPAIVITRHLSKTIIEKLKAIGVKYCFKKPVALEPLLKAIFELFDMPPAGHIHGITLPSFLQLIHLEQKTCSLTIRAQKNKGVIHCVKGEVIGAQASGLVGKIAFHKMIIWNNPDIRMQEGSHDAEQNINIPLMHLLLESHHFIDTLKSGHAPENQDMEPGIPSHEHNATPSADESTTLKTDSELNEEPDDSEAEAEEQKKLEELLPTISEISNYGIFNRRNELLNETSLPDEMMRIAPAEYFVIGNVISHHIGENLKYLTLKGSNRSSYTIIRSNRLFIAAKLKHGVQISDVIRHIKL